MTFPLTNPGYDVLGRDFVNYPRSGLYVLRPFNSGETQNWIRAGANSNIGFMGGDFPGMGASSVTPPDLYDWEAINRAFPYDGSSTHWNKYSMSGVYGFHELGQYNTPAEGTAFAIANQLIAYGAYSQTPMAAFVEQWMYYMSAVALKHGWNAPTWYLVDENDNQIDFIPQSGRPYNLTNHTTNDVNFYNQLDDMVDLASKRFFYVNKDVSMPTGIFRGVHNFVNKYRPTSGQPQLDGFIFAPKTSVLYNQTMFTPFNRTPGISFAFLTNLYRRGEVVRDYIQPVYGNQAESGVITNSVFGNSPPDPPGIGPPYSWTDLYFDDSGTTSIQMQDFTQDIDDAVSNMEADNWKPTFPTSSFGNVPVCAAGAQIFFETVWGAEAYAETAGAQFAFNPAFSWGIPAQNGFYPTYYSKIDSITYPYRPIQAICHTNISVNVSQHGNLSLLHIGELGFQSKYGITSEDVVKTISQEIISNSNVYTQNGQILNNGQIRGTFNNWSPVFPNPGVFTTGVREIIGYDDIIKENPNVISTIVTGSGGLGGFFSPSPEKGGKDPVFGHEGFLGATPDIEAILYIDSAAPKIESYSANYGWLQLSEYDIFHLTPTGIVDIILNGGAQNIGGGGAFDEQGFKSIIDNQSPPGNFIWVQTESHTVKPTFTPVPEGYYHDPFTYNPYPYLVKNVPWITQLNGQPALSSFQPPPNAVANGAYTYYLFTPRENGPDWQYGIFVEGGPASIQQTVMVDSTIYNVPADYYPGGTGLNPQVPNSGAAFSGPGITLYTSNSGWYF